tara:strand:- start:3685 stop:5514 length:1830 start_codon:yes stop_codon:yes gene_type:complete
MASLFVKGMIGGALDEATERNRRRDDAIDKMTNLAIDNINQARKIQAERESLNEARNRKAKSLSFIKDPDMAKAFLNDFDPNNSKNVLELQKIYRELTIQKGEKLSTSITPTVPLSGATLPTATTGGTFGDMFKMPTTMDAFTRAEQQLGLKPGEGAQYYETASQSYRPNVLEQEFSYSYGMRPETGVGTIRTEELTDEAFINAHGGSINAQGIPVFGTVVSFANPNDSDDKIDIANDIYFGNYKNAADKSGRFRSDKYEFSEEAMESQDNQNIRLAIGQFVGSVTTANAYIESPDSGYFFDTNNDINLQKFNFLTKGDQTGKTRNFLELAQDGIVGYEEIIDVLVQNNDPDAMAIPTGQVLNAVTTRPAYSLPQLEAIALNENLTEKDFTFDYQYKIINAKGEIEVKTDEGITLKQAQERWDTAEDARKQILLDLIGPEATEQLMAGVYGTGDYRSTPSLFSNIDDGLSGTNYDYVNMGGSLDIARPRLENVLRQTFAETQNNYKPEQIERIIQSVDRTTNNFISEIEDLTEDKLIAGYSGNNPTKRALIPMEYNVKQGDPDALASTEAFGIKPGQTGAEYRTRTIRHYRWLDIETGKMYDSEYNEIY